MYHIFFIHYSVNGHSGCVHVLVTVNSAAMNTAVHVSFQHRWPCMRGDQARWCPVFPEAAPLTPGRGGGAWNEKAFCSKGTFLYKTVIHLWGPLLMPPQEVWKLAERVEGLCGAHPRWGTQTSACGGCPSQETVTHGGTPDLLPQWPSFLGDCHPWGDPWPLHGARPSRETVTHGGTPDLLPQWPSFLGDCHPRGNPRPLPAVAVHPRWLSRLRMSGWEARRGSRAGLSDQSLVLQWEALIVKERVGWFTRIGLKRTHRHT